MSLHPAAHNPGPGLLLRGLRCKVKHFFYPGSIFAPRFSPSANAHNSLTGRI